MHQIAVKVATSIVIAFAGGLFIGYTVKTEKLRGDIDSKFDAVMREVANERRDLQEKVLERLKEIRRLIDPQ